MGMRIIITGLMKISEGEWCWWYVVVVVVVVVVDVVVSALQCDTLLPS